MRKMRYTAFGAVFAGSTVTWAVTSGGGSASPLSGVTTAAGATATAYTAGTTSGTSTVTATVAGLTPVTFTTTVTAAAPVASLSIVSGNNQSVLAGATVSSPFVVKVFDQYEAEFASSTVTWAVANGGGSVNPLSGITMADGTTSTTYTAGTTAGTFTVTATVSGLTPVTYSATATSAPAVSCDAQTTTTAKVVCLANAFKTTLTTAQQTTLQPAFTKATAIKWSNLPCGSQCRNGLQFSTLTATQLTAALAVAQAALSSSGYRTFDAIRKADTYLGQNGGGSGYNEGIYFMAFLDAPSTTSTWMLQVGGHHHAANIIFKNGTTAASITPNFVGVEPQSFTLNGTTYAPLDTRKTAMYNMIQSLDATQLAAAKLSTTFDDVLLGPNQDRKFPAQQGVLVSSLTSAQQALVKTAMAAWVNDAPSDLAAVLLAEYQSTAALATTRIAWSGATTPTVQGSYVRIDGPNVWLEFVCQNGVVFPSQIHFHTIFRDKTRDYGGNFTF